MSENSTEVVDGTTTSCGTDVGLSCGRPYVPLISEYAHEMVKLIFDCFVQQAILLLGIPGNIICCIVFVKEGLRDRINLLLFSLAIVDLLNLVCQLLPKLSCYIQTWDGLQARNWDAMMAGHVLPVSRMSAFISGSLMVVMSVDRCLVVIFPLAARTKLSYRTMLAVIIITYMAGLCCYLPNFLIYTVRWSLDPTTNRSLAKLVLTDLNIDHSVPTKIIAALSLIVKPVSVAIVIVCCIITTAELHRASRQRLKMQRGQKGAGEGGGGDKRITQMLIFVCVIYVLLILPEVGSAIVNYFLPEFFYHRRYHNTFIVVYQVIFTASCLNSSANFFAYFALSTRFRRTLQGLCPGRSRRCSKVPESHADSDAN